ncbi:MAG: hypothetical protein NZ992_00990 [Candidatus Korarchaeum sp.]|nr:hypothetical protein [Candidatus Korarchaeum sp.]MDW8035797.1 hypothetical protein [Candidatus Korarchaeum sp.]
MRLKFLLLLLLITVPTNAVQSQNSVIENAVEKPMESVARVPEFKSISEVPRGSYGFVNGVLYVDKSGFTFGAIPDLEFNIYASLIIGEALQAYNFADLDPSTVAAAKSRLSSIASWLVQSASEGAWGSDVSGRLVDTYFTSLAVKAIALAITSGSLPKEKLSALSSSVSKLISLQDEGGGWGRIPQADVFQYKQPTPTVTAAALKALLTAREAGLKVPDASVNEALSYFAATSSRSGNMVYWEEPKSKTLYVTSEVADAIAEALYQGYSFDNSLLSGLINYLEASVKQAYSSGTYDYMTAAALSVLAKFSSLGYLETDKLISNYEAVIVDLANTIRPDGLFTDFPFIWLRYSYTYPYVAVFVNWLRVSSVSSTAYFVGGYGEYSPTVLVEGTSLNLKVSVANKISKPLSLIASVSVQPPASLSDKGEVKFNLDGGKEREFTFKIAAPDGLTSAQNVSIKMILREANSSKPIFAKSLPLRLVRNPVLNLESKVATPSSVQLRKPVNVTITFSNRGDLPITDLTFVEKLASGFELVTTFPGNGTALVTSTSSLGSYVMPQPLAPGSKVTLVYQAMPVDAPPGPQAVSTTFITYTDARGERHNSSKEVKVTVLRPYLVLSSNASSLSMEWDEEKVLLVAISNVGNEDATEVSVKLSAGEGLSLNLSMVPEEVMYKPNPDGSLYLRVDKVASGSTITLPVRVKATNFYPSHELGSFVTLSYEYKDAIGRSMSGYSGSNIVKVTLLVSKTFLYMISAIVIVIALLIAIRIRNRARASPKRSPLLLERRKRGRIPFES